jgi:hypothetical protein
MPPALKRALFIGVPTAAAILIVALIVGFDRIGNWFRPAPTQQANAVPVAPATMPSTPPAAPAGWKAGDRVLANWRGSGYWFPGVIREIQNGRVAIEYDDGEQALVDVGQLSPEDLRVGDQVDGRWKAGPYFWPGTITARTGNAVTIQYNDGDVENTTLAFVRTIRPRGTVRPTSPTAPPTASGPGAAAAQGSVPPWMQGATSKGGATPTTMPAMPPGAAEMIEAMSPEKMIQLFPKIGPDGMTFPGMPTVPVTPTSKPTR